MEFGIHLPQYGRAAGADAITRAARHAESLGFAHIWVSDHVVHPAAQDYPSPHLLDPLLTLTWAAAATERIGLGTSVMVVPQHNPLWLANALASLDTLAGGRLTVGAGVGWSKAEYAALGYNFENRGQRMDEILDLFQVAWHDDPASFHGEHYAFDDIRFLPKPAHEIPVWIGGAVEAAFRRAVDKGDGFHAVGIAPADAPPIVERLRRDRPEESFVISTRTGWDPQGMDPGVIRAEREDYEAAGVQYVLAAPWQKDTDSWLQSMDLLAEILQLT